MGRSLLLILLLIVSTRLMAQEPEPDRKTKRFLKKLERYQTQMDRRTRFMALPALYFTPETGWAGGVSGMMLRYPAKGDTLTRMSQLQLSAVYTQNRQVLTSLGVDWYTKDNLWHFDGLIGYYQFPFYFAGVGNGFGDDYWEDYSATFPKVTMDIKRLMDTAVYAGLHMHAQNVTMTYVQPGGLLDTGNVVGSSGGRIIGLGGVLEWDTRDFPSAALKGQFVKFEWVEYAEIFGSEFEYRRISIDARKYLSTASDHTIALQARLDWRPGEVPFNQMSMIGGQYLVRGYPQGLYRDQYMAVGQVEYRSPYILDLMGVNVFASIGGINSSFGEVLAVPRAAAGAGIRFPVDREKRINFRLDLAWSTDATHGYYFGVSEAF